MQHTSYLSQEKYIEKVLDRFWGIENKCADLFTKALEAELIRKMLEIVQHLPSYLYAWTLISLEEESNPSQC